jgi:hypothetical protein
MEAKEKEKLKLKLQRLWRMLAKKGVEIRTPKEKEEQQLLKWMTERRRKRTQKGERKTRKQRSRRERKRR